MIQDLRVLHREYSTARSFEEVVTAFQVAVGTLEDIGVPSIVAASKDVADFEARAASPAFLPPITVVG
jgi:hypothetical protein